MGEPAGRAGKCDANDAAAETHPESDLPRALPLASVLENRRAVQARARRTNARTLRGALPGTQSSSGSVPARRTPPTARHDPRAECSAVPDRYFTDPSAEVSGY